MDSVDSTCHQEHLKEQVAAYEKELASAVSMLERNQNELLSREKLYTVLEEAYSALKERFDTQKNKIESLEKRLENSEETYKAEIQLMNKTLKEKSQEVQDLLESRFDVQTMEAKHGQEIKQQEETYHNEIRQIEEKLSQTMKAKNEFERLVEVGKIAYKSLERQKCEEVAEMESAHTQHIQKLQERLRQNEHTHTHTHKLQHTLHEKEAKIIELTSTIASLKNEVLEARTKNGQRDTELKQEIVCAEEKAAEFHDNAIRWKNEFETQKRNFEMLQTTMDEGNRKKHLLTEEVNFLKARLQEFQTSHSQLQQQHDLLKEEIAARDEHVKDLMKERDDVAVILSGVQDECSSLKSELQIKMLKSQNEYKDEKAQLFETLQTITCERDALRYEVQETKKNEQNLKTELQQTALKLQQTVYEIEKFQLKSKDCERELSYLNEDKHKMKEDFARRLQEERTKVKTIKQKAQALITKIQKLERERELTWQSRLNAKSEVMMLHQNSLSFHRAGTQ